MEKLESELEILVHKLPQSDIFLQKFENVQSVYPFSRYEYMITKLVAEGILTYDDYILLRDEYINRNMFLYVFEISAPRGFGDTWAFSHLISLEQGLKRPNKKIDPDYDGQYDLYLESKGKMIRIEVKASRCVDRERPDDPLYLKALMSDTKRPFLMNFQQLKPSCCDVFLWIAVYRDKVNYWVLSSIEVSTHPDFTPQHRNLEKNTRGKKYDKQNIYEGQIMITEKNIKSIADYAIKGNQIKKAIIQKFFGKKKDKNGIQIIFS